jgi:glycosyltransferase involved in cell wall biosynthesis
MGCGVPVVASKIMPITELVVQGETGLLFSGHNVQDAVKQLYVILDNPALHQHMSQAAIDHVQHTFAIHIVADKYVDLLRKIYQLEKGNDGEVNSP